MYKSLNQYDLIWLFCLANANHLRRPSGHEHTHPQKPLCKMLDLIRLACSTGWAPAFCTHQVGDKLPCDSFVGMGLLVSAVAHWLW